MGFQKPQSSSLWPRSPQTWRRYSTWQRRQFFATARRIFANSVVVGLCGAAIFCALTISGIIAPRSTFISDDFVEREPMSKNDIWLVVHSASQEFKVPAELVWAVITVESNFKPDAISHVGAKGLMQLMPATIKDMEVSDPYDPVANIRGGTRYLRYLLDVFKGNRERAIAAYNAGLQKVKRHRGIPPYGETRRYVKKVMEHYRETLARRSDPNFGITL